MTITHKACARLTAMVLITFAMGACKQTSENGSGQSAPATGAGNSTTGGAGGSATSPGSGAATTPGTSGADATGNSARPDNQQPPR